MPLTTEQKNLRALIFPGKRGKLDKNDQKIFARLCAEKGFPLSADNEPSKPASRKRKRRRYSYKVASSSEEHDEALEEDDEIELEEVTDQEQQEDEEAADDIRDGVKSEFNEASDDEPMPAAAEGPANAAKRRRRVSNTKYGRPSTIDTAAQALMGLTGSIPPAPAAAAAGRQRIAAALPAAGYKPFAGVPLRVNNRHGAAAGQQCDAPYDYYDVYQSYLACMDMYSKAAGRLGVDAVAAPIPPEELLGPAYASHLSLDKRAPHWTPEQPSSAPEPSAAAAEDAAELPATRASGRPPLAAATARPSAALGAHPADRRLRRSAAGAADAVQAAAKRPYHRRSSPGKAALDGAGGQEDQQQAAAGLGTAPAAATAGNAGNDGSKGSQQRRNRLPSPLAGAAAVNGDVTGMRGFDRGAGDSSDMAPDVSPAAAAAAIAAELAAIAAGLAAAEPANGRPLGYQGEQRQTVQLDGHSAVEAAVAGTAPTPAVPVIVGDVEEDGSRGDSSSSSSGDSQDSSDDDSDNDDDEGSGGRESDVSGDDQRGGAQQRQNDADPSVVALHGASEHGVMSI